MGRVRLGEGRMKTLEKLMKRLNKAGLSPMFAPTSEEIIISSLWIMMIDPERLGDRAYVANRLSKLRDTFNEVEASLKEALKK